MTSFAISELIGSAASDGGSASMGPLLMRHDFDDLLRAWSIERGHNIECEILLGLSLNLIARLRGANAHLSTADQRDTDALVLQIDRQLRKSPIE